MLEIGGVAGCHGRTMRACNGGNHGIKLRYRAARCFSRGHNAGKRAGGILIEGQDAALKLLGEHLLDGRQQSRSALAGRQRLYAVENFCLRDGGGEYGRGFLRCKPTQNDRGRQGFERFGGQLFT